MRKNYIVAGTCPRLLRQVLLALRSTSNANCIVIGGEGTRNLKWSSLCEKNIVLNFHSKDGRTDRIFANLVNDLSRALPDATLIPADCEGTRMINRVKDQLRVPAIPHADPATLEMLDNKWSFFEFCSSHGLTVPSTIYIGDKSRLDFQSIVSRLGLPFVIKPTNQAGSTGVQVVHSEEFLNRAVRDNDAYRFDTLIAQEYIDGIDLCFNFFAMGGEICAYTIQRREGSTVHFLSNPALQALGQRLAHAAAYDGVMCIDARVDAASGKVYLIESNPRFWASLGASVWCGVNFVTESVRAVRRPHSPLTISSGLFHERHPVLRPAAWKGALFDVGARGRFLRAHLRDLPAVADVMRTFPRMAWNYALRRVTPRPRIGLKQM